MPTESIGFLKKHTTAVKCLNAEIKNENRASIGAFKRAGFLQVSEENDLLLFECKI